MAGERKGKAYEAIILVALEELCDAGLFAGEIFSETTPDGMSIHLGMSMTVFFGQRSCSTGRNRYLRHKGSLCHVEIRCESEPDSCLCCEPWAGNDGERSATG